jgi:small subunit ribosomal protein S18
MGVYMLEERRRRYCRFCADNIEAISYRDAKDLRRFVTDRGKIVPRRVSGVCAKHQRQLSRAIKTARELSMLPYVSRFYR